MRSIPQMQTKASREVPLAPHTIADAELRARAPEFFILALNPLPEPVGASLCGDWKSGRGSVLTLSSVRVSRFARSKS